MAYEGIAALVTGIKRERTASDDGRIDLVQRRIELSRLALDAHDQAADLAVTVLDRHGVSGPTLVPGNEELHVDPCYFRKSGAIALGEQFPDDGMGLTYGFAIVGATYRAHQLTRERRIRPIFRRVITEVVGIEPTNEVSRVNVGLLQGTADGGVTHRLADLTTTNGLSFSSDPERAVLELAGLLAQRQRAVRALEILADGGMALPPMLGEPA